MSDFPLEADIPPCPNDVGFGPHPDMTSLFDHLDGLGEQRLWATPIALAVVKHAGATCRHYFGDGGMAEEW
jgi:hypothetical protein